MCLGVCRICDAAAVSVLSCPMCTVFRANHLAPHVDDSEGTMTEPNGGTYEGGRRRPRRVTGDPWLDKIRVAGSGTPQGFAYRPNELIVDRRALAAVNGDDDLNLGLESRIING